jgi:hypothetical protein
MNATTMDVLMECGGGPKPGCKRHRAHHAARRLRTRIALALVAIAALGAGLYGERWMLREAPLPAFEYVVATCAAFAVEDEQPSSVCTSTQRVSERDNHE